MDTSAIERSALEMPWGRMSYLHHGAARNAIVLLHGAGCSAEDWLPTLRYLQEVRAVLVPEFRGHGHSDVPAEAFSLSDLAGDLAAFCGSLDVQKTLVIGHSLGGMVALEAARAGLSMAALMSIEGWTRLSTYEDFAEEHHYGSLETARAEEIARAARDTRERIGPARWSAFWKTVEAFDASSFLAAPACPVLELFGAEGRGNATRESLRIPEKPTVRFAWIEHAGHYLPQERPLEVARAIEDAFRQFVTID